MIIIYSAIRISRHNFYLGKIHFLNIFNDKLALTNIRANKVISFNIY